MRAFAHVLPVRGHRQNSNSALPLSTGTPVPAVSMLADGATFPALFLAQPRGTRGGLGARPPSF